jgi:hypothetical protein
MTKNEIIKQLMNERSFTKAEADITAKFNLKGNDDR